jgi:hypothetical protein
MRKMGWVGIALTCCGGKTPHENAPGLPGDLVHLVSLEGDQATYRRRSELSPTDADKYLVVVHRKVYGHHHGRSIPGHSQPTDPASLRDHSQ